MMEDKKISIIDNMSNVISDIDFKLISDGTAIEMMVLESALIELTHVRDILIDALED